MKEHKEFTKATETAKVAPVKPKEDAINTNYVFKASRTFASDSTASLISNIINNMPNGQKDIGLNFDNCTEFAKALTNRKAKAVIEGLKTEKSDVRIYIATEKDYKYVKERVELPLKIIKTNKEVSDK